MPRFSRKLTQSSAALTKTFHSAHEQTSGAKPPVSTNFLRRVVIRDYENTREAIHSSHRDFSSPTFVTVEEGNGGTSRYIVRPVDG